MEMPSFPHSLCRSPATAHLRCFTSESWGDQKYQQVALLSVLISSASSSAQLLWVLGKKCWLQVCCVQISLLGSFTADEGLVRISLITAHKVLLDFTHSLPFVENKRGLPSYQGKPHGTQFCPTRFLSCIAAGGGSLGHLLA